jgi:hypothetical protein
LSTPAALVAGKSVSVGQFLAHNVPLNNLDDISGAMSILLDDDFYFVLDNACAWNQRTESFDMHHGDFSYEVLAEAIRVRHIICHESTTGVQITGRQAFDWMLEAITLVGNTETIIASFLIGGEMYDSIWDCCRHVFRYVEISREC